MKKISNIFSNLSIILVCSCGLMNTKKNNTFSQTIYSNSINEIFDQSEQLKQKNINSIPSSIFNIPKQQEEDILFKKIQEELKIITKKNNKHKELDEKEIQFEIKRLKEYLNNCKKLIENKEQNLLAYAKKYFNLEKEFKDCLLEKKEHSFLSTKSYCNKCNCSFIIKDKDKIKNIYHQLGHKFSNKNNHILCPECCFLNYTISKCKEMQSYEIIKTNTKQELQEFTKEKVYNIKEKYKTFEEKFFLKFVKQLLKLITVFDRIDLKDPINEESLKSTQMKFFGTLTLKCSRCKGSEIKIHNDHLKNPEVQNFFGLNFHWCENPIKICPGNIKGNTFSYYFLCPKCKLRGKTKELF
ncbi:MAG: hypothetical protein GY830_10575 [Bacteroidetes bacterium]|nr:hypothetical protein [Bacteroidota bacterium]